MPTVVGGHTFTVDVNRYDLDGCRILGRGSYGVVTTAVDKLQDNLKIAIKRIRPYANDEWDARHTLREIRLLRVLGPHPNVSVIFNCCLCTFASQHFLSNGTIQIISLYDLSLFEEKTELYMMMEVR